MPALHSPMSGDRGRNMLKKVWLGGRDSNPDTQIQNLQSYRWTTSQRGCNRSFAAGNAVGRAILPAAGILAGLGRLKRRPAAMIGCPTARSPLQNLSGIWLIVSVVRATIDADASNPILQLAPDDCVVESSEEPFAERFGQRRDLRHRFHRRGKFVNFDLPQTGLLHIERH
jgi:hypothetical protein